MREFTRLSGARGGALAAVLAAVLAPSIASAQYIQGNAPPMPVAPMAGTYESPSAKLARNVRVLAQEPRNFAALIAAGRASLALGDIASAEGFFARADEVRVNDPAPKVGMAGAAVLNGNLDEAQVWFGQAQRLGATQALLGTDRGMLLDLKGDLGSAQSDYRAALAGPDPDETRRRYALSLAMGSKMDEALKILEPLLRQRDPAALRVRAFVLALGGQKQAAITAIDQAMPGSGSRMAPFFDSLAVLGVAQKAAAVHLGIFPSEAEVRLAKAQSLAAAPTVTAPNVAPPVRVASRTTAKTPPKRVRGKGYTVDYSPTVTYTPTPAPTQEPAPVQVAQADVPTPLQAEPQPAFNLPSAAVPITASAEVPPADPAPQLALAGDRLSGIDKLLAEAQPEPLPPPPPPPRPKVESPKAKADAKPASTKKAETKKADAKKAEPKEEPIGVAGSTWVQLAGGSNADRMAAEYKRIKAKKPELFAKRSGHVTKGKDYFRLVVGPFKDAGEARTFVNSLAKAGIDAFMWTRSPPSIRIEKLASK